MISVLPSKLLSLTKPKWRQDPNGLLDLDCDFNSIRVRSFILTGAPIAYKATNIAVRGLFAGNDGLQRILTADDPDDWVIAFSGIDDGADVALASVGIAAVELLLHKSGKRVNLGGVDGRYRVAMRAGTVERGLGQLAM